MVVEEDHKIVDSAQPKHLQTTAEVVAGVSCMGWVHNPDVGK